MTDEFVPTSQDYRTDPVGPSVRLPGIEETPIGQETLFSDLEAGAPSALLTSRFVVPPFSVLDSRAGYWQSRKAQWLALGIQSELGREGASRPRTQGNDYRPGSTVDVRGGDVWRAYGKRPQSASLNNLGYDDFTSSSMSTIQASGVSIFDPVLCEIAYRWFAPPAGTVLDPFAGGSVRGVVASMLGHRYTGIDLSEPQVEANREQAEAILSGGNYRSPVWISGDSVYLNRLLTEPRQYDLLFSCPPYYDLEVYGDAPGELSAMQTYEEFLRAYRIIIGLAAERLKPDRFAVWVIGEIRDRDGFQRGLVADTIKAFADAGLRLYNEAVLVTPVGTLMLRVPKQFISGRTLGRSHQSVLVFWKGQRKPAWKALHAA